MSRALIVFRIHSFVDLITNSSSELFVINKGKSLEIVKDVLLKVFEIHNLKLELAGKSPLPFDSVFSTIYGNITESKWDVRNTEKFNRASDIVTQTLGPGSLSRLLEDAKYALKLWESRNPRPSHTDMLAFEEDEWAAKYIKECKRVWEPYRKKATIDILEFLQECFKYNNISLELIKDDIEWGGSKEWVCPHIVPRENLTEDVKNAYDLFNQARCCLLYRYTINKGDILVESASCNSIPSGMIYDIEEILPCKRLHTG